MTKIEVLRETLIKACATLVCYLAVTDFNWFVTFYYQTIQIIFTGLYVISGIFFNSSPDFRSGIAMSKRKNYPWFLFLFFNFLNIVILAYYEWYIFGIMVATQTVVHDQIFYMKENE